MDVRSGFWSLWPPRWTMGRAVTLVFPSSPLPGRDNRDSVLLAAALDIAHLAMKTVREGSLSPDELLRMHRCTEVIKFLSAAGLVPIKPEENRASLQPGESSSSIDAPGRDAARRSPPRLGRGTGKRKRPGPVAGRFCSPTSPLSPCRRPRAHNHEKEEEDE